MTDKKAETFILTHRWIYQHPEMTDTDKLMCGLIMGLSSTDGYCYASNAYLSKVFEADWDVLSDEEKRRKIHAIRMRISRLKSKGILTVFGEGKSRKITLRNLEECHSGVTLSGQKVAKVSLPSDTKSGQSVTDCDTLPITIIKKRPNQDLATIESDFVRFWTLYPRKEKKLRAEKIFKKLSKKKRSDLMAVLDLIPERYAETQKQFIPLPPSFLNDERWYDEYFEKKIAQNGAAKVSQPETGLPEWVTAGVAQIAALADGEYDVLGAEGRRVAEVAGMTPEAAADWLDDYGRDDFMKRVLRAMETDVRGAA